MGIVTYNLCRFCNTDRGLSITVYGSASRRRPSGLNLTPALILFGYDEKVKTDAGFDYILLVAKVFLSFHPSVCPLLPPTPPLTSYSIFDCYILIYCLVIC